jgi:hypothetical protein
MFALFQSIREVGHSYPGDSVLLRMHAMVATQFSARLAYLDEIQHVFKVSFSLMVNLRTPQPLPLPSQGRFSCYSPSPSFSVMCLVFPFPLWFHSLALQAQLEL